jgi:hypothetical protein
MSNLTISIFGNKTFFEILNELKLFSSYKIEYCESLDLSLKDTKNKKLFIFFELNTNKNLLNEIEQLNLPLILISKNSNNNFLKKDFSETIKIPFTIIYFKKKLISLIAKNEFRKNSVIQLNEYIIDKNERKIKKNNLELYLSEKEINFLVMFSQNNNPISKDYVLKNVWNYSSDTETHTVETHIHRLRKKILEKFNDNNFIKNNNKGYYI